MHLLSQAIFKKSYSQILIKSSFPYAAKGGNWQNPEIKLRFCILLLPYNLHSFVFPPFKYYPQGKKVINLYIVWCQHAQFTTSTSKLLPMWATTIPSFLLFFTATDLAWGHTRSVAMQLLGNNNRSSYIGRCRVTSAPRDLASQKQCTWALSLISLNTLIAFLHNFLILPFSHHALLDTHNPPLLICTPPFSHHHGVPKYTHFTRMTLRLAQK